MKFFSSLVLPALLASTPLCISTPVADPDGNSRIRPMFTLNNIKYTSQVIYSTPAHLAVSEGTIDFNLTNTEVPYTTHCRGENSNYYGMFYDYIVYACDEPTGLSFQETANFTFSSFDWTFHVNQTWHRQKGHHISKTQYLGYGTGQANTTGNCVTKSYITPNWTIGEIYSTSTTTCTPPNVQITPIVIC